MTYLTNIQSFEDIFCLEAEDAAKEAARKEAERLLAAQAATRNGLVRRKLAEAKTVNRLREEAEASRESLALSRQVLREALQSLSKTPEYGSREGTVKALLEELTDIREAIGKASRIVEDRLERLSYEQWDAAQVALQTERRRASKIANRLDRAWEEWNDFCRATLRPIQVGVMKATRDYRVAGARIRAYSNYGKKDIVTHKPLAGLKQALNQ